MISSCIVRADLAELKAALKTLDGASYETSVDGAHIVLIEADCVDDMVGIYSRLERLCCVRACELIFTECDEIAAHNELNLAALSDPSAPSSYYPAQLLRGL